jgi:hypothetical protein
VEGTNPVLRNAEELERLGGLTRYAELLREAADGLRPARYAFKLEFPDGSWDLVEQELTHEPRVGDLVWFDGAPWQILGVRDVPRRPSDAEPHHFLACTPAA